MNICLEKITNFNKLNLKNIILLNSKNFKCYLCLVSFTNKSNLARHCNNFCIKKKQLLGEEKTLLLSKKNRVCNTLAKK